MMGDGSSSLNPQNRLANDDCYYWDYLQLGKILDSQDLRSASSDSDRGCHDEMLFIIVHQTFELWFKQILWELEDCFSIFGKGHMETKDCVRVLHHLHRVSTILQLAVHQFDVLETMTPRDFMDFRDFLFPASGFQSVQYRILECKLGIDAETRKRYQSSKLYDKLTDEHQKIIKSAENTGSLFEAVQEWLERIPFLEIGEYTFLEEYRQAVVCMFDEDLEVLNKFQTEDPSYEAAVNRNRKGLEEFISLFSKEKHEMMIEKGLKRLSFRATQAALLITLYQDEPVFFIPYQLLQKLIDLDEFMTMWRYRHMLMVQRMIGTKLGTGGSSGYGYLKSMVERSKVFRDLSNLASYVVRTSAIPPLPDSMRFNLEEHLKEEVRKAGLSKKKKHNESIQ